MRSLRSDGKRAMWATTILATLLVVVLAPLVLDGCDAALSGAAPTAPTAISSGSGSGAGAGRATIAWTQFADNGAVQIWIAAADTPPRVLATLPPAPNACPTLTAGLPMPSPDGAHLLVSEGQPCGGLVLDPGPLFVIDTARGKVSPVPLPDDATVLPQVRSYGWVDNHTVVAFSPKYNLQESYRTYLYTLGAAQAQTLAGLDAPMEGVVRGTTLFYLTENSQHVPPSAGGIQSIVRRYDLAHRAPIAGGIDLGAYAACGECPDMVISPGWDVAADGSHVVFQSTTPGSTGGIATSQILYATADGGGAAPIAQDLATNGMVHLRLSPDGKRVAITAAYPSPAVLTACVNTPGTKGDPCFATYRPDAVSMAAWSADGRSFLASTVDASYERPTTQSGSLVHYTLGSATGQPTAVGYGPWSAPDPLIR